MTLVNGTDENGYTISGLTCFTLDEGTASVEDVCGTASGTAISSLTRGVNSLYGTSSLASLKKEHRRGATVKITNSPQIAIVSRILNGDETLPNPIKYESTISTSTLFANGQYLASVNYVNGVALQGAPLATTTLQGLVQAGTANQISSSVQNGSTGAVLFAPGNLFASSSSANILIPVTQSNGKLNQNFLDLTQNWTFSGSVSFTGTATFGSGIPGTQQVFPGWASTTVNSSLAAFGATASSTGISATNSLYTAIGTTTGMTILRKYNYDSSTGEIYYSGTSSTLWTLASPPAVGQVVQLAVVGNYLYASWPSTANALTLYRFNLDLTDPEKMTISGNSPSDAAVSYPIFARDNTSLLAIFGNASTYIYSISSTTATYSTPINLASVGSTDSMWADGTSVYQFNPTSNSLYKWPIGGGDPTITTSYKFDYQTNYSNQAHGAAVVGFGSSGMAIITSGLLPNLAMNGIGNSYFIFNPITKP
jgi:hypothetical protein